MANLMIELQNKRLEIKNQMEAIHETAKKDNRPLTDEERAEWDALIGQHGEVAQRIDDHEVLVDIERAMPVIPDDAVAAEGSPGENEKETYGFLNCADFARSVMYASKQGAGPAQFDRRLLGPGAAPTNFHQETSADEGYMVPPAFRRDIWSLVFEQENLLDDVDAEPTDSNSVQVVKDESTPWGATGVQANWEAEGVQFTASKVATNAENLRLNKLYAFVLATEELLEDAPRLNARLTTKSAEAIRWKINEAIIDGDGVGKPLGWTASAAQVSVAKEGSQVAATIVAANIGKMFGRLLPQGISRSLWMINPDAINQLMLMTVGNQPIWTPPASGFANAPGGFLMGRPIRLSEHCETLGTKNDIQFVDPKGYYAATKQGGTRFATSIHLFFDYDMMAFRWTFRVAGQPHLSAPVGPAKGSNNKSHFVTLDTRA